MKKRFLSILLCLVMVMALLPTAVFAEEDFTIVKNEAELTAAAAKRESIQLAADITIHSTLKISGTVTLDLNGYVLNYESDTDGSVIEVEGNSELTLEDSRPDAEHKFKVNDDGLWVLAEKKGTKTISGGVITGGHAANGGGIIVGKATLTMNGGNIVGCSANLGGGVYLTDDRVDADSYARFIMCGGRICGCSANNGGAVFISGEVVSSDITLTYGFFWTSLFDMRGGTIENCVAEGGSVVEAPLYGKFKMSGGEIKNCTGEWTVHNYNGDFSLTGGAIYGNIKYESNGNFGIIPTVEFAAGVTVYGRLNLAEDKRYVKGELPELIYFYTEQGTEGNDDTVYAIQVLNMETPQPAKKIEDPTKAGYKFEDWYDDWNYADRYSGFNEGEWAKSCGDGYAKWTETDYTVRFDTDGGNLIGEKTGIKWTDTVLNGIDEPEKSGYTFAGWKYGNTLVTESTTYAELIPNDDAENDTITLKAQWNAIVYDDDDPSYSITVNEAEHGTVTSSCRYAERGENVTLIVEPDKGWTLETLTVTNQSGKEIDLDIVEIGEKYTFKMPSGKVTVTATFMEDNTMLNYFVDVNAQDYFYDAVLWAAGNGVTSGTDDSHFSPNAPCTRAQIVTFLWRAAGSPVVNYAMTMGDVPADAYYTEAVRWALSEGITKGTGDTTFSPDATCSRGQIVTFLYRSEQIKGNGMNGTWMFQNPFTDVNTEDYYGEAVMWAVANKVTEGTTSTTFSPDDNCTRAHIVTFIWRALAE